MQFVEMFSNWRDGKEFKVPSQVIVLNLSQVLLIWLQDDQPTPELDLDLLSGFDFDCADFNQTQIKESFIDLSSSKFTGK